MMPTDWLLRRLDSLDAGPVSRSAGLVAHHRPETPPLLYLLLDRQRSPVVAAQKAYVRMGMVGPLGDILILWWRREGRDVRFWRTWALRALSTLLHQAANLEQRLQLQLSNFPLRMFAAAAAVHFSGGRDTPAAVGVFVPWTVGLPSSGPVRVRACVHVPGILANHSLTGTVPPSALVHPAHFGREQGPEEAGKRCSS